MTTTTSWISKKPDRCGGDACIRDTRITVWGLMEWRRLGLTEIAPLRGQEGPRQCKIVVFVPDQDLARVSNALFSAGAGQIGQYRQCSFRLAGTGTIGALVPGRTASRCRRLLGAMLVSVLRPIGRHITDRGLQTDCPAYGF